MRFLFSIRTIAMVLVLGATTVQAQFDSNGPNAALTVNGKVASSVDATDHDIQVPVPGDVTIRVSSGSNPEVGILMCVSSVDPTTGSVQTLPWGTFDIGSPGMPPGNIDIIGDGIAMDSPADEFFVTNSSGLYEQIYSAAASHAGERFATQMILADPTMPPFNFDNTEAADVNLVNGQVQVLPLDDAGMTEIAFAGGNEFDFHGGSYSSVFVNSNGFINFGGPTFVPDFAIDPVTAVNTQPSIHAVNADWNPTQNDPADGVLYEEIGQQLRIAWGDPASNSSPGISHFADTDVNQFELMLELTSPTGTPTGNEGTFSIKVVTLDENANQQLGDGFLGHTPGQFDVAPGGNFVTAASKRDVDLQSPRSFGPGEAGMEEHNATGGNFSTLGFDGLGTPRHFNDVTNWSGQEVTFVPNPTTGTPGDTGYSTTVSQPPTDAIQGFSSVTMPVVTSIQNGGQVVTVVGKFFGASSATTVTFDPDGTAGVGPITAAVIGVLDGTGQLFGALPHNPDTSPLRNGEGLVISTPFIDPYTGPIDVKVDIGNGVSKTLMLNVTPIGSTVTTLSLADDASAQHGLNVNVDLYGQTYTEMFVSSNGFVTFNSGSSDFSATLPEFYDGWGDPSPNPGVAILWSDLNPGGAAANGSSITITEDSTAGTVQVDYDNQNWWTGAEPAGDASATFGSSGPGSVSLDLTGVIPASAPTNPVVIGITDGTTSVGPDTDLTDGTASGTGIFNQVGTYTSPSAPDSIGEAFLNDASLPFVGPVEFVDMATAAPFGLFTIM